MSDADVAAQLRAIADQLDPSAVAATTLGVPAVLAPQDQPGAGVLDPGFLNKENTDPAPDVPASDVPADEPVVDPAHADAVAAATDTNAQIAATPVDQRPAQIAKAEADLATVLTTWPDSPELQDLKTQLDLLAAETDPAPAPADNAA